MNKKTAMILSPLLASGIAISALGAVSPASAVPTTTSGVTVKSHHKVVRVKYDRMHSKSYGRDGVTATIYFRVLSNRPFWGDGTQIIGFGASNNKTGKAARVYLSRLWSVKLAPNGRVKSARVKVFLPRKTITLTANKPWRGWWTF